MDIQLIKPNDLLSVGETVGYHLEGLIGAVIGLLPALGGSISDWIAYGQTVATNPNEKIPFAKVISKES